MQARVFDLLKKFITITQIYYILFSWGIHVLEFCAHNALSPRNATLRFSEDTQRNSPIVWSLDLRWVGYKQRYSCFDTRARSIHQTKDISSEKASSLKTEVFKNCWLLVSTKSFHKIEIFRQPEM